MPADIHPAGILPEEAIWNIRNDFDMISTLTRPAYSQHVVDNTHVMCYNIFKYVLSDNDMIIHLILTTMADYNEAMCYVLLKHVADYPDAMFHII